MSKSQRALVASQIELDKLCSHYSVEMLVELRSALDEWSAAVDRLNEDNFITVLWHWIRFKHPPAIQRAIECRKRYEEVEAKWNASTSESGQYWA